MHPRQMQVPRLGVKLELQLPAFTIATETWDLSHICDLYDRSRQCRIFNPLSKARHHTCVLMDTSWVHYCWAIRRTHGKKTPWKWRRKFQLGNWNHENISSGKRTLEWNVYFLHLCILITDSKAFCILVGLSAIYLDCLFQLQSTILLLKDNRI